MKRTTAKRNINANRGSALFKKLAAGLIIAVLIILTPTAAWAEKDEREEDQSQNSEQENLASRTGIGSQEEIGGKPLPGIEIWGVEIHPVLEGFLRRVVDPRAGGMEPDHFGVDGGEAREGVFGDKDLESLGVDDPTDPGHTFEDIGPGSRFSGGGDDDKLELTSLIDKQTDWDGSEYVFLGNGRAIRICPDGQRTEGTYDESQGHIIENFTPNEDNSTTADNDNPAPAEDDSPPSAGEDEEERSGNWFTNGVRRLWDKFTGRDNGEEGSDNTGSGSTGSDNPGSNSENDGNSGDNSAYDDVSIEVGEPRLVGTLPPSDESDNGNSTCECEGTCSCGDNSNKEQGCEGNPGVGDNIGDNRGIGSPINPSAEPGYGILPPSEPEKPVGPDDVNPFAEAGYGILPPAEPERPVGPGDLKDPNAEGAQPDMPRPDYNNSNGTGGPVKDPNTEGARFDQLAPQLDSGMKQPGNEVAGQPQAGTFDRAPSSSFHKAPTESGALLQNQVTISGDINIDLDSMKKMR